MQSASIFERSRATSGASMPEYRSARFHSGSLAVFDLATAALLVAALRGVLTARDVADDFAVMYTFKIGGDDKLKRSSFAIRRKPRAAVRPGPGALRLRQEAARISPGSHF